MARLRYIYLLALALLTPLVIAACSDDTPASVPIAPPTPSSIQEQAAQLTPAPAPAQEETRTLLTPSASSDCQVGQVVAPEDSCAYPGTSEEFRVDESGIGHFLLFTAKTVIQARNALINNQAYDFAARKQDDGNWIIEVAGTPSDSVRVSDLVAVVSDTPTPTAAPALTSPTAAAPSPVSTPLAVAESPAPTPSVSSLSPVPTSVSRVAAVTPEPTRQPSTPSVTPTPEIVSPSTPTATPTPEATPAGLAAAATPASADAQTNTPAPNLDHTPQIVTDIGDRTLALHSSVVMDASRAFPDLEREELGQYSAIVSDGNVAHARINSVTGELTLTGLREGTSWVVLGACDASRCTELGEVTFLLTVAPHANLPPQAAATIPAQDVRLGETISVPLRPSFWDVDGDSIVDFDFQIDDQGLVKASVDSSAGRMNIIGSRIGSTSVSVRACDGEACGDENSALRFTVNVLPPANRPPSILASISDQSVPVGETITLDISTVFEDPEGEPIQDYGVSVTDGSVAVGSMDSRSGVLTLRGAKVGSTFVAVDASDGGPEAMRSGATFRVTVTEPLRSPPSVVTSISDQTVELGKSVKLSVAPAFDAPERYRIIRYDLLLRKPEIGTDSEITRGGVLTLKGSEKGKSWVSVRACSYLGCSDFLDMSFVLIVTDSDEEPNHAPEVVGGISDRTLALGESETLDLSPAFKDDDHSDRILDFEYTFSRPIVAVGSSISNTGTLYLYGAYIGETTVSVSACDEQNECSDPDDFSFKLTVTAPKVAQR